MGMCKANRGNLMQHWTLCECLTRLQSHYDDLHFVTTHSMAPWAIPDRKAPSDRSVFLQAGARLERLASPSPYEAAWQELSVCEGLPYPSSAVFASHVWQKSMTVALCENEPRTADEINGWLATPQVQTKLQHSALLPGDWRSSFANPDLLRTTSECMYIEMDPMRYDTRGPNDRKSKEMASLYPDDIELVAQRLATVSTPIVLQVSSFSTQNNIIPLDSQRQSLVGIVQPAGFALENEIRVGMQMASFVFIKSCRLQAPALGDAFNTWLGGIG